MSPNNWSSPGELQPAPPRPKYEGAGDLGQLLADIEQSQNLTTSTLANLSAATTLGISRANYAALTADLGSVADGGTGHDLETGDVYQRTAAAWVLIGNTRVNAVSTLAALRVYPVRNPAVAITVRGYATPGDGGEGVFLWRSGTRPADDGGILIWHNTDASGWFERQIPTGEILAGWFGVVAGSAADQGVAFAKAINGAKGRPLIPPLGDVTIPGIAGQTITQALNLRGRFPGATRLIGSLSADFPLAASKNIDVANISYKTWRRAGLIPTPDNAVYNLIRLTDVGFDDCDATLTQRTSASTAPKLLVNVKKLELKRVAQTNCREGVAIISRYDRATLEECSSDGFATAGAWCAGYLIGSENGAELTGKYISLTKCSASNFVTTAQNAETHGFMVMADRVVMDGVELKNIQNTNAASTYQTEGLYLKAHTAEVANVDAEDAGFGQGSVTAKGSDSYDMDITMTNVHVRYTAAAKKPAGGGKNLGIYTSKHRRATYINCTVDGDDVNGFQPATSESVGLPELVRFEGCRVGGDFVDGFVLSPARFVEFDKCKAIPRAGSVNANRPINLAGTILATEKISVLDCIFPDIVQGVYVNPTGTATVGMLEVKGGQIGTRPGSVNRRAVFTSAGVQRLNLLDADLTKTDTPLINNGGATLTQVRRNLGLSDQGSGGNTPLQVAMVAVAGETDTAKATIALPAVKGWAGYVTITGNPKIASSSSLYRAVATYLVVVNTGYEVPTAGGASVVTDSVTATLISATDSATRGGLTLVAAYFGSGDAGDAKIARSAATLQNPQITLKVSGINNAGTASVVTLAAPTS